VENRKRRDLERLKAGSKRKYLKVFREIGWEVMDWIQNRFNWWD
jgi:hypothetical protein